MCSAVVFFFFNDPSTPEIYTLSLHDALPISLLPQDDRAEQAVRDGAVGRVLHPRHTGAAVPHDSRPAPELPRSEEHTSELQSQFHLVCRLLLEKKNKIRDIITKS